MNKENQSLSELVDELMAEKEMLKDQYLRQAAEFDNYRKRTQAEKLELVKIANESLILNILPVLDDFERAVEARIYTTEDLIANIDGYRAIGKKLKTALEKENLERFDPIGEDFNPDFHEAIGLRDSSPENKGKVIECVQPGYKLSGKIIRYAKVIVGK